VILKEPVASARGLQLVVRQDLEWEVETPVEFVLPLLREAARADNETPLEVTAGDKFLDQQTGHDGLPGAGIVGEEKSQRLAWEQLLVNRRDLVRQWFDYRSVNGKHRVEEVSQSNTVSL
jgi:hypothetical protein